MVTGRIYIECALYYVRKRVKAPVPCGFGFSKELEWLHVFGWLFYSSLQIYYRFYMYKFDITYNFVYMRNTYSCTHNLFDTFLSNLY